MGDEIKEEVDEKIDDKEPEPSDDLKPEGEDKDDLETADTAEPDPASIESDDQDPPSDVPYARFAEVVSKVKEGEEYQTKLDQFKRLGPDGYYQLYPDEKPDEPETKDDGLDVDIGKLMVEGGLYDGKTINEVLGIDQAAGTKMLVDYYREQDKVNSEEKDRKAKQLVESEAEIKQFSKAVSQGLYEKAEGLTEEETGKVEKVVGDTLKWMNETNRGGGVIADAYILMHHEAELKKAKGDTLKGIVDALKKGTTPSISSTQTLTKESGYARFLSMDAKQVASELDKLDDDEQMEFLKKAPPEVRKKFPDLPWDD